MEDSDQIAPDQEIDFCTLGMFIIDEIHYLPPKSPVFDVLGGAGTYSAIGARLFSPPPLSKRVGWVVDQGSDFPPELKTLIRSWETSCLLRYDGSRLTTRGWNGFDASENRAFRYTTPKLRIDADSIISTPLLRAKCFHLICNPTRCLDLVRNITTVRKPLGLGRPIFIWEPVPDLCIPSELLNVTRALPYVDICSPNAAELGALLGYSLEEVESSSGHVNPDFVEQATEQLLASMSLSSFAIVVRAGKSGCYLGKNGGRSSRITCFEPLEVVRAHQDREASSGTKRAARGSEPVRPPKYLKTMTSNTQATPTPKARPAVASHGGMTADTDMMALLAQLVAKRNGDQSRDGEAEESSSSGCVSGEEDGDDDDDDDDDDTKEDPDYGTSLWLPAYHTSGDKVVDPTGGGNAFLGGLAVSLARGKGLEAGCRWASVAASFAIEQVGGPVLTPGDAQHEELWNGDSVRRRLAEYETRLGLGLNEMKLS